MKAQLLILVIIIFSTSCVPQSKYDNLKSNYDDLLVEKESLQAEINSLKSGKGFTEVVCNENIVLNELNNYLEFYCPECLFKDFKIRNVDFCKYDIRMKKKSKDNQPYPNWIFVTVRMTLTGDGKFYVEDVDGSHKWACSGFIH